MWPEDYEEEVWKIYMMVPDGEPVEVSGEPPEVTCAEIRESAGDTMMEKYAPEDIARVMDSVAEKEMELCRKTMREELENVKGIMERQDLADGDKIVKAGITFAKKAAVTLEEAIQAILDALQKAAEWTQTVFEQYTINLEEQEEQKPLDIKTERGRKEARERRQTVDQANAARFRQYRTRETARAVKKRTGPRGREWHGPWRE